MVLVACAALIVLLHGCGGDAVVTESASQKPAELVAFTPTVNVKLVWSAQLNRDGKRRGFTLTPVAYEGKIFVTESGGRVAAYNAATGILSWETLFDETLSSGAGAGQGLIAFGAEDGDVIVLNSADGSLKWRAPASSEVLAAPQFGGGKVIAALNDGKLIAFDAATGQRIWISANNVPALSLRGSGRPVIVGDRVVTGFANGHLAAFNIENGKRLWETTVAVSRGRTEIERLVDIDATPRVIDGTVYAGTYQGQVAALSLENGQTLWSREASTTVDIAVDETRVYVADAGSQVWALDRKSGAPLWRQENLQWRAVTAPAIVDEYLVVADLMGYVHWLRRDNGHFVARTNMEDADRRAKMQGSVYLPDADQQLETIVGVRVPPSALDDKVLVRDVNGVLAAYRSLPLAP